MAVFLVLLVFGLVLLFSPDLASDLDERSAGGASGDPEDITVTEEKRTTEEVTESERGSTSDKTSRSGSNQAGNRGGAGPPGGRENANTSQTSTTDETTSTTTSETITTETMASPENDEGAFAEIFAVPAVTVLSRLGAIMLLAGLATLPLLGASRRNRPEAGAPTGSDLVPAASPALGPVATPMPSKVPPPKPAVAKPAATAAPAAGPNVQTSNGNPRPGRGEIRLPVKPVVTRREADRAKVGIMEGIPLLVEVFEARGEPKIANTLPDMRVRVNLTDTLTKEQPLPVSVLAENPQLALATFRTELEQRLRRLTRDAVAQSAESIDSILRSLTDEGLFEPQAAEGFSNLLKMTERAMHGARVDPAMGAWIREEGVSILLSLDLMLPS